MRFYKQKDDLYLTLITGGTKMGKNFDFRPYSINDFREWNERGELKLSPKFQRRRVWSDKAKSYLVDTILRGLPIPPVFIRQQIDQKTRKTIREIILQSTIKIIVKFYDYFYF